METRLCARPTDSTRPLLSGVVAHLGRWLTRLRSLDDKSEALEVAIAIATGLMSLYFLGRDHPMVSRATDMLFAVAPRPCWVWLTGATGLVGLLGFLEDSTPARRTSAFLSFAFWFGTGAYLLPRLPGTYLPLIHMLVGFFASWAWTRIAELKIKKKYRALTPVRRASEEALTGTRKG